MRKRRGPIKTRRKWLRNPLTKVKENDKAYRRPGEKEAFLLSIKRDNE